MGKPSEKDGKPVADRSRYQKQVPDRIRKRNLSGIVIETEP